ncbi:asparagine synthase-related protein [Amylibacter sp.]|nr:asparagine synthase-related protein [Amylibacter sp.]
MNILLNFTKNKPQDIKENIKFIKDELITTYSLKEFLGWYGVAFISVENSAPLTVDCDNDNFFVAGGVYTSSEPLNNLCDLNEVLKNISGHYLIVQQRKNGSILIATDPMSSIPLYIYKDNGLICMSTRLDWLITHVKREWNISWEQIFSFVLNSGYAGRRVFIDDIYLAEYGSIYSFSNAGEFVSDQFWSPPFSSKSKFNNEDYKAVADVLEDVVRTVMNKYNKIVIPLTAGVDSRLVLAAALKIDRSKVETLTHGFTDSNHPDVKVAIQLAKAASVPHKYLDSNNLILDTLAKSERDEFIHKTTGGQTRHNFIYDLMMYDCFDEMGYDLELKGLAGGLFKAKWHSGVLKSKITEKDTKKYRKLFGGKAKQALFNLDEKFMNICQEDCPNQIDDKLFPEWLSFAVRFSNRIAPRTFFQINRFNSFNPFYDRKFLDSYLNISFKNRENAMVHLKMIEYLSPELLTVPYLFLNKYYMFVNGRPMLINNTELATMGYKNYKKSVSRLQYFLRRILSKIGLHNKSNSNPVPADWEYIKGSFLNNLKPVLDDAKFLFPDELENISFNDFISNPNLDSRSFRFYSLMKFISYCSSKGVSFK